MDLPSRSGDVLDAHAAWQRLGRPVPSNIVALAYEVAQVALTGTVPRLPGGGFFGPDKKAAPKKRAPASSRSTLLGDI